MTEAGVTEHTHFRMGRDIKRVDVYATETFYFF